MEEGILNAVSVWGGNLIGVFHTRFLILIRNFMLVLGGNLLKFGGVAAIFGAAAWL
jgi:hypothetical protein